MKINNMSNRHRLWFDIQIGKWWYVFIWTYGIGCYGYRSLDATPPHVYESGESNQGKWLFGRRVGVTE